MEVVVLEMVVPIKGTIKARSVTQVEMNEGDEG